MGLCADSTAKEETQVSGGSGRARILERRFFPKPSPLTAPDHTPTAHDQGLLVVD